MERCKAFPRFRLRAGNLPPTPRPSICSKGLHQERRRIVPPRFVSASLMAVLTLHLMRPSDTVAWGSRQLCDDARSVQ